MGGGRQSDAVRWEVEDEGKREGEKTTRWSEKQSQWSSFAVKRRQNIMIIEKTTPATMPHLGGNLGLGSSRGSGLARLDGGLDNGS